MKTFLPVFNGFNDTLYQLNEDRFIESENQYNDKQIDFDDLEIDYTSYENDIAVAFCDVISNDLKDFVHSIQFEHVYSPTQYNYSNDSINCDIKPKLDVIKDYVYSNRDNFELYLKNNYTSCDGFISGYSNSFDNWVENTQDFTIYNEHELGSILQFIHNGLNIDSIDTYYDVTDGIYEGEYITILDKQLN